MHPLHLYVPKKKKQCRKLEKKCSQNYLTAIAGSPNSNTENVLLCCEKDRVYNLLHILIK